MSSTRRRSTWVAASLGALVGCSGEVPAPPEPAPSATTAPDELAPGELAEGPTTAFGLPMPAHLKLDELSPNYVRAHGKIPLEVVANYIRSRVDAGHIITGPAKTVFDDVTVKRPRGAPQPALDGGTTMKQVIRIEVATVRGQTTLVGERTLREPFVEGLTDDQRWEENGLTKQGKPVDPYKFE